MTALTQTPREEAIFFENEGKRLFGVLHTPTVPDAKEGLIFCAPYGEEKHFTHRTFVKFARQVCEEGIYVLRFDYRGNGDSEGDAEDSTWMNQLSDIKRAIKLMANRGVTELGLFGLRLGGTLAALAASSDPRIRFLIIWAPIVRPKEHFDRLFRNEQIASAWEGGEKKGQRGLEQLLKSQGLVEMAECSLSRETYDEFSATDLTELDPPFSGDLLIADVAYDTRKYRGAAKRLSDRWADLGYDHEFRLVEEPDLWTPAFLYKRMYPQRLCDATLEWLTSKRSKRGPDGAAFRVHK